METIEYQVKKNGIRTDERASFQRKEIQVEDSDGDSLVLSVRDETPFLALKKGTRIIIDIRIKDRAVQEVKYVGLEGQPAATGAPDQGKDAVKLFGKAA